MKTINPDDFLKEVVSTLKLGDFRFTKETMNTKVDISDEVKQKLKRLCVENKNERVRFNELYGPSKTKNVDWGYDVIAKYFNLQLKHKKLTSQKKVQRWEAPF